MDRIKKFDIENGKPVMQLDGGGDFIYKNELLFLLYDKKRELENMQKHINTGDNASEWDKKYYYGLTEQIELLNHLIDRI